MKGRIMHKEFKEFKREKSRSGGLKEQGRIRIWINPFEFPSRLPVQVMWSHGGLSSDKQISELKPLLYDQIEKHFQGYGISERSEAAGIIYIDEDGRPHLIHGNVPYKIKLGNGFTSVTKSFWAVDFPVEQENSDSKFRVRLTKRFDSPSVLNREILMVKTYHKLPISTPGPLNDEVKEYTEIFRDAVSSGKLMFGHDIKGVTSIDERAERYDLRDKVIYTIDSETTKDIDDAIEVIKVGEGQFILGVHIADVSEFVKQDSRRDLDARDRATSHYLADTVIHMLPECLSQDYCSLGPHEDRLAISVYAEIHLSDLGYDIRAVRFCRSLINSRAKLTYDQVEDVLAGKIALGDHLIEESLRSANTLAQCIETHSPYKDLSYDSGNVKYHEKPGGKIGRKDTILGASDRLIEMLMITANEEVGKRIADMIISTSRYPRGVGVYRVQSVPKEEDLQEYMHKIKEAGLMSKDIRYSDLKGEVEERIEALKGRERPVGEDDKSMLVRSGIFRQIHLMARQRNPETRLKLGVLGRYAVKEGRILPKAGLSDNFRKSHHLSLGIDRYAWFTSPIRRYCDIVNHRQVKAIISMGEVITNPVNISELAKRVKNADYAEEALNRRLLIYHLCDQHRLVEQTQLDVMICSIQWVVKGKGPTLEILGLWKSQYPVTFSFRERPYAEIRNHGLTCQLEKRTEFSVGEMVRIQLEEAGKGVSPEKGEILIKRIKKLTV